MPKSSIEQQGLFEPESFDLDDLESADPLSSQNGYPHANGHAQRVSSGGRKTLTSAPGWLRQRWIVVAIVIVAALLVVGVALNRGNGFKIPKIHGAPAPPPPEDGAPPNRPPDEHKAVKQWKKPEGFKIIGLIFFGRPSVVAILDCYLKKNLVTAGGWLDEVHFVVNTEKEDDINYLDELVKTSPLYKKIIIPSLGYNAVWRNAVEREHMYIKIDDDIVSIYSPFNETRWSIALKIWLKEAPHFGPFGLLLLIHPVVWLCLGANLHPYRSTSMTKPSPTSSTPKSITRTPLTSSPTSSTAPKQAGYTTALAPSTPTFPS